MRRGIRVASWTSSSSWRDSFMLSKTCLSRPDVSNRSGSEPRSGSAQVGCDPVDQRVRETAPVLGVLEARRIVGMREVSDLDEHRGHGISNEHVEASGARYAAHTTEPVLEGLADAAPEQHGARIGAGGGGVAQRPAAVVDLEPARAR